MDTGTTLGAVSLTLQVAQGLLTYYDLWQGCDGDIQELQRSLLWLTNTFTQLELTLEKPQLPEEIVSIIRISINGCRDNISKLYEILNKVKIVGSPSGIRAKFKAMNRQSLYIFHSKEIKSLQKILDSLKDEFSLAVDLLHLDTSATTLEDLRKLNESFSSLRAKVEETREEQDLKAEKRTAEEVRSDILSWIAPTLTRKPIEDQHTIFEKRDPETSRWFLDGDELRSWRNPNGPFMWMYGDVGCGKTILCSSIIDELKKSQTSIGKCQSTSLVYFYFAFDDVQKQDLGMLLRSALEQLCPRDGILPQIKDLYQRCEPDPPSTVELQQTFLQALRFVGKPSMRSSIPEGSKPNEDSSCDGIAHIYIVLDGLDEVQYGPKRNAILKLLKMISALDLAGLHLLVSSRRETDIELELLSVERWQPLHITQQSIKRDLNIFVTNQILDSQKLRSQSELVKSKIKHKLVDGANGMFRWTALQMQELNKKRVLRPREIMDVLTSLPKDIHATYDRILSNIEDSLVHEAVSILKWLSCSSRPLFIEELAEACIIRPKEDPSMEIDMRLTPSDILEILPGLIAVDPPIDLSKKGFKTRRHIFSLAHFSVKEYLFNHGIFVVGSQNIEINAALAQIHIAECCFSYIRFCELNNASIDHGQSSHELDLFLPLKLYSYSRWAIHAASIPEAHSKKLVTEAIQLFCQPKICHQWMMLTRVANRMNEENKPCVLEPSWFWHSRQNWPISYLLCCSIATGNKKIIESLLKMEVPISGPGAIGEPLALAAKFGQAGFVDMLLKAGACKFGALITALQNGNEDIAWRILQSSDNVDSIELITAAKRSSQGLMTGLIKKTAGIELIDINRAISAAISSSNFGTANALLDGIIARGQASDIFPQEGSSRDAATVWQGILSSATTLNSRSLLCFLLREVPLNVIERLNTQDLYLLSVVLGCSQATNAFVSYPWFKIPTVARMLARKLEIISINSPISAIVVGIHDICTGRYPIPSAPMQQTEQSTLATWSLLKQWRPDIVAPILEKWGFTTIDQLMSCEPYLENDYPQGVEMQRRRTQSSSNSSNYRHDIEREDPVVQRLARKFGLDLFKSSSRELLARAQQMRSQSLNVHHQPPLQKVSEMQYLLQRNLKVYMVLSGPYSERIKDFVATEIFHNSLLLPSSIFTRCTTVTIHAYEPDEGRGLWAVALIMIDVGSKKCKRIGTAKVKCPVESWMKEKRSKKFITIV